MNLKNYLNYSKNNVYSLNMATSQEVNDYYVPKWLKEANEKGLTVLAMIGIGTDGSTEVFGLEISKKELAEKFRRMADQIDGYGATNSKNPTPGPV